LGNSWVYIGTSNGDNEAYYIKALVNDFLCRHTMLQIPDVDLNNYHVRFQEHLIYMGFGSDFDIVKDMGSFDNTFHDVGVN